VYRYDDQGRLESWNDEANDDWHGLAVTCLPDGRVWYLAYYKNGDVVGVSRSWKSSDGSFASAMDHDANGHAFPIAATPEMMKRPDHLCQPQRCDVNAKPDLTGIPKKP
jgi:hypothetical protein